MKRLYFPVPDTGSASKVVDDLLLARIEERQIHVLAKREASLFQKTDFVPAAQRGLLIGGVMRALARLVTLLSTGIFIAGGPVGS